MGITAKTLSSSTFDNATGKLTLNFANATSIEAGKPYLVKVNATVQNPTFENVSTVSTTTPTETTYVDFIPTLGRTQVAGNVKNILFLGANNTLLNPSAENQYIKGFRAYFQLKGDAANAPALSFSLDFGDGETTGVIEVRSQTEDDGEYRSPVSGGYYDLQGRRINGLPTQKGVYIVNGKKTIIK